MLQHKYVHIAALISSVALFGIFINFTIFGATFVDKEAPTIQFKGATVIEVNVGSNYIERGAYTLDNVDGKQEGNIRVSGSVDTNTVGQYLIKYNASDRAGNKAKQRIRLVKVLGKTQEKLRILSGRIYNVTDSSVEILWTTNVPSLGIASYGENLKSRNLSTSGSEAKKTHSVKINGLKASTKYYFRVHSISEKREAVSTHARIFTTERNLENDKTATSKEQEINSKSTNKALVLEVQDDNSVKLTWKLRKDSVGYSIRRNGKWIAGKPGKINEYVDTSVSAGETATYKVSSRNSNDPAKRKWTIIGEETIKVGKALISGLISDPEPILDPIDPSKGMQNITSRGVLDTRSVKAFPGAEGGGQDSKGGRGGKLYIVNTRDCSVRANDGKISIREALEAVGDVKDGPRYITFSVGGLFDCGKTSRIKVKGNLTLACQTAPSPGVQIAAYRTEYSNTSNIIVRGCQFFTHDYIGDAASSLRTTHAAHDNIFDHVNFLHSPDDTSLAVALKSSVGNYDRLTLSNSIVAEGDAYSTHKESPPTTGNENRYVHSMGPGCSASHSVKGNRIHDCSFIGNLIAHNSRRNPKFWASSGEIISNYIYNPQEAGISVKQFGASKVNIYIEDNIVKYGPNTKNPLADNGLTLEVRPNSPIQMKNNKRILQDGTEVVFPERQDTMIRPKLTFNTKYNHACVGAKYRDENIERILKEVVDGTGEAGIGTFGDPKKNDGDPGRHWLNNPDYYTETKHPASYDSDNDGIADDWERANGLVVGKQDYNGDIDGDGYRNIEEFINSQMICGSVSSSTSTVKQETETVEKVFKVDIQDNDSVKITWSGRDDSVGYSIRRDGTWIGGKYQYKKKGNLYELIDKNIEEGKEYTYKVSSRSSDNPTTRIWTIIGEKKITIGQGSKETEEINNNENSNNSDGSDINSKNVLLVGNSYTRYRQTGYPGGSKFSVNEQFESMLQSRVSGATVMPRTTGGATLKDHWDTGTGRFTARGMILSGDYDTLVLQGKTGNMRSVAGRKQFHEYADKFSDLANSKGMKIIFYGLWAHDSYISLKGGDIDGPRAHTEYTKAANNNNALYSPNGMVYSEVYKKLAAKIGDTTGKKVEDLMTQDSKHPDVNLAYLVASTLYSAVTGERAPPVNTYKPSPLSESDANMLRNYSWKYYNQYKINNAGGDSHDNDSQEDSSDKADDEENQVEADSSELLAFPGAEGYARHTTGGRGGEVVIVNTTKDIVKAGDGLISLREALEGVGDVKNVSARYVTFAVGGVFDITGKTTACNIKHPIKTQMLMCRQQNITVACQTAPSPGVIIRTGGIRVTGGSNNIIMRHCTVRNTDPGPSYIEKLPGGKDGRDVGARPVNAGDNGTSLANNTSDKAPIHNIIYDHMSLSWSTDEGWASYISENKNEKNGPKGGKDSSNITLANSIIAEGDPDSTHSESGHYPKRYTHSHGPNCSGANHNNRIKGCSIINNFIAHNGRRNPKFTTSFSEAVNNITYNWGSAGLQMTDGRSGNYTEAYAVGNLFKVGKSTVAKGNCADKTSGKCAMQLSKKSGKSKHQVRDNLYIPLGGSLKDAVPVNAERDDQLTFAMTTRDKGILKMAAKGSDHMKCIGASVPERDVIDQRVIDDFYNNTGRIGIFTDGDDTRYKDQERRWYMYPALGTHTSHSASYDKDRDGMADTWERKNGLNPNINDANGKQLGDGYDNIEHFINELANSCYTKE